MKKFPMLIKNPNPQKIANLSFKEFYNAAKVLNYAAFKVWVFLLFDGNENTIDDSFCSLVDCSIPTLRKAIELLIEKNFLRKEENFYNFFAEGETL